MSVRGLTVLSRGAVVAAALGLAAGCGSSSGSTSSAGAPVKPSASATVPAVLKHSFAASEAATLKALSVGAAKLKSMPSSFSGSRLRAAALGPMVSATEAFDHEISGLSWPASLQPQEKAVLAANQAWLSAATGLESSATTTKAAVAKKLAQPLQSQVLVVDRLRGSLGLPPI
jgi:hypothetical protein